MNFMNFYEFLWIYLNFFEFLWIISKVLIWFSDTEPLLLWWGYCLTYRPGLVSVLPSQNGFILNYFLVSWFPQTQSTFISFLKWQILYLHNFHILIYWLVILLDNILESFWSLCSASLIAAHALTLGCSLAHLHLAHAFTLGYSLTHLHPAHAFTLGCPLTPVASCCSCIHTCSLTSPIGLILLMHSHLLTH